LAAGGYAAGAKYWPGEVYAGESIEVLKKGRFFVKKKQFATSI
jgi:hypothetical protein